MSMFVATRRLLVWPLVYAVTLTTERQRGNWRRRRGRHHLSHWRPSTSSNCWQSVRRRLRGLDCMQGRINHSGAPYQRKAGALFWYAKPGFSYLWRCTFFPQNDDFLVVVTFKRTLNGQTSKQRGKKLAADRRGPPCDGGASHGTTGTMDNPALTVCVDTYHGRPTM